MKELIVAMSAFGVLFLFMHELDACYKGEWRMFAFLRRFKEETQYLIFLYAHIPLTLFLFYYLWTVVSFSNIILWVLVNIFCVLHFALHIIARTWKSNVFQSIHSFIFIGGAALTGLVNLLLVTWY
ncbi:MAG TPA: hypothetical protein PKZ42_12980 [Syntrophales bacterium]|nr:hypothetical protein [Syntrophales bacterium]